MFFSYVCSQIIWIFPFRMQLQMNFELYYIISYTPVNSISRRMIVTVTFRKANAIGTCTETDRVRIVIPCI